MTGRCQLACAVLAGLISLGATGPKSAGPPRQQPGKAAKPAPATAQYDPPATVTNGHDLVRYYLRQARNALGARTICRDANEKRELLVKRATYQSVTAKLNYMEFRGWTWSDCITATGGGELSEWVMRLQDAFAFALSGSDRPVREFRDTPKAEGPSWIDSLGASAPTCREAFKVCTTPGDLHDCTRRVASESPCKGTALGTLRTWLSDGSARGERAVWASRASLVPGAKYRFPAEPMNVDWSSWGDPVLDPLFDEYQRLIHDLSKSKLKTSSEPEWPKSLGTTGLAVVEECNLTTWNDRAGSKPVEFQRVTCSVVNRSSESVMATCQALVYDPDGAPIATESADLLRVPAQGRGILQADLYGVAEDQVGYVEFACE